MASFDNRQLRAVARGLTLLAIAAPVMCSAQPGLYSLEQAPLIRQRIVNMEAMGDAEAALELEQELLALARRHPDDLRTVPIFRGAADERADVLRRFLAGEVPSQILLGCYYDFTDQKDCNTGTKSAAIRALGLDAQRSYSDAIAVILRNALFSSDVLRELEMSIVRVADLVRPYDDEQRKRGALSSVVRSPLTPYDEAQNRRGELSSLDPTGFARTYDVERERAPTTTVSADNYRTGRTSLERLVAYEYSVVQTQEATSGSLVSLAAALVAVADWDLLYSVNQSALEEYELAYRMLQATDAAQSSLDEPFSPATPVVLPAFRRSPLSASQEAEPSAGYIDVAFEITRYGKSRRIEVLDTMNASRDGKRALVSLIKQTTFRPRVAGGQLADSSTVTVRYYVSE